MLTTRGLGFFVILLFLLAILLWTDARSVTLILFTLLGWFCGSWLLFVVRWHLLQGKLFVVRRLLDDRGKVQNLWAGRTFTVQVRLQCDSTFPSPYFRVTDRVPYGANLLEGEYAWDGNVSEDRDLELEYRISCPAAGKIRFEGLQVQVADLQGFFYYYTFIRAEQVFRVMPAWADVKGQIPTSKDYNLLPLLGSHRHRRPGSGSELLDLRDYFPGDPPRTIAWKVSARRDKLITKVFESEVPIRCTFFMDTSQSVRVGGPGQNALARLVEITASVAQASAGSRDLPGLCLFDERQVRTYLRPSRSPRHLVQILQVLGDAAALLPESGEVDETYLLPLAIGFAQEVYPDLMKDSVNTFPWWYPFWAPQPPSTFRLRPIVARRWWHYPWVWLRRSARYAWLWIRQQVFPRLLISAFFRWDRYQNPTRRRVTYQWGDNWRKKLSALLAARYTLGPGGLALLMEDGEQFSLHCQRFLADHHVPYTLPYYGLSGQYLFAAPGKIAVLASNLLRTIGKGKDNELFVLLVDLLELDDQLTPLLAAVKVGVARHHQVVVICPWPPGVPAPAGKDAKPEEKLDFDAPLDLDQLEDMVTTATDARFHRAYHRLRRAFGKLGVPFFCTREENSVKWILDRLERLRQGARGIR
jgi:uncharacterized protein (DUF58 family)